MKQIYYPANERGTNDLGWLKANFSFSFGPYYDPSKINFGALRVLNDDLIAAGRGFGYHPHDNMEIITIPLAGALEHKDSLGNVGIIKAGEVQIMSAGTGVEHSEYNPSDSEVANTLQIWLFPKEMNIAPRYGQKRYADLMKTNQLAVLVSPDGRDGSLKINQDAIFSMGVFEAGQVLIYDITTQGNGAYVFLIEGSIKINSTLLNKRDALGVYNISSFSIEIQAQSRLLIMDIPV